MAEFFFSRTISSLGSQLTDSGGKPVPSSISMLGVVAISDISFRLEWREVATDASGLSGTFASLYHADGSVARLNETALGGASLETAFPDGRGLKINGSAQVGSSLFFSIDVGLLPGSFTGSVPNYFDDNDNPGTQDGLLFGTSADENVVLGDFNDRYISHQGFGSPTERQGGVDFVFGDGGDDAAQLYNVGPDGQSRFAGFFDGGPGTDTIEVFADPDRVSVMSYGNRVFVRDGGTADRSGLGTILAEIENVERLEASDGSKKAVLEIDTTRIDAFSLRKSKANAPAPDPSDLAAIRDFDGNDLGAAAAWKFIGTADMQYDDNAEFVFVNPEIGRWATVGTDASGKIDYGNHGEGGDTRVVGIYIDPEVEAGRTRRFSEFDSQQRFQNDLRIDNLAIIDAFDFDADGFQEVYFRVTDGTAYLRALMHADGNIQYANYQNEDQVRDYLTGLGYGAALIDTIIG